MAGVPLVGSRAGAAGEAMREGVSRPVDDVEDVDACCAALRLRETPVGERSRPK